MTRRLRPPVPLEVQCGPDGQPIATRRGGRRRVVTRVAATWVRPAPWWDDLEDGEGGAPDAGRWPRGARTYYRLVLDRVLVYEAFRSSENNRWYLDRIVD